MISHPTCANTDDNLRVMAAWLESSPVPPVTRTMLPGMLSRLDEGEKANAPGHAPAGFWPVANKDS